MVATGLKPNAIKFLVDPAGSTNPINILEDVASSTVTTVENAFTGKDAGAWIDLAVMAFSFGEVALTKPPKTTSTPLLEVQPTVNPNNGKLQLGPNVEPQRYQGPWTEGDLNRAMDGNGPVDLVPTTNKAGKSLPLELHHADQMPG